VKAALDDTQSTSAAAFLFVVVRNCGSAEITAL